MCLFDVKHTQNKILDKTLYFQFDFDTFSEQVGDLKWLESKKAEASAGQAEALSAARKLAKNQVKWHIMHQK
jgi:hypothetical protein